PVSNGVSSLRAPSPCERAKTKRAYCGRPIRKVARYQPENRAAWQIRDNKPYVLGKRRSYHPDRSDQQKCKGAGDGRGDLLLASLRRFAGAQAVRLGTRFTR